MTGEAVSPGARHEISDDCPLRRIPAHNSIYRRMDRPGYVAGRCAREERRLARVICLSAYYYILLK